MNLAIGTEAAQFPFWEYFFLQFSVQNLCRMYTVKKDNCFSRPQPEFH